MMKIIITHKIIIQASNIIFSESAIDITYYQFLHICVQVDLGLDDELFNLIFDFIFAVF